MPNEKMKNFIFEKLMIFLIVVSIIAMLFSPIVSKCLGLVDKSYWGVTYVNYEEK